MPLGFRGLSVAQPINRLLAGIAALAVNVRSGIKGAVTPRNLLTAPISIYAPTSTTIGTGTVITSLTPLFASAWSYPANIISTSAYATASFSALGPPHLPVTRQLQLVHMGFSVPSNVTITGIGISFQCDVTAGSGVVVTVTPLSNGSVPVGVSPVSTPVILGANTYSVGGQGQLFGGTWTPADVNGLTGMGVSITVSAPSTNVCSFGVNSLQVTIYYAVVPPLILSDVPHTIRRLNDSTPNGPASGYALIIGAAGKMYVNFTAVASGLSGNPVSLIPSRPNASVQPWMYVGDSSESVTIPEPGIAGTLTPVPTMTSVLWTNPANALSTTLFATTAGNDNALYATVSALTLPTGASITGVSISWSGFSTGTGPSSVSMYVGGVLGGAFPITWPLSDNYLIFGGSSVMWGWSSAQIASGFAFWITGPFVGNSSVNGLQITVFYSGSTSFTATGMLKIRSDGLTYKMGIEEPQLAPVVSTSNTSVPIAGTLLATSIPWTNYTGANSSYNYGETNGYPSPTPDGDAPFVIDCSNASTITFTSITGTATINGNASATPTTAGPSTALTTNPGHYVMVKGTGVTPPATATVVIGAFTDGAGNVIPVGQAPLYIPSVVDVGGLIGTAITVPFGAQTFQVGINSAGNTFASNSGSFTMQMTVNTNALPTVTSILGSLTIHYWGDSPTSGPVSAYIWKNPSDPGGSGPTRTISDAVGSTTGNSFIFDATFTAGIPALPGIGDNTVPMEWTSLTPESVASGANAVFQPAMKDVDGNTAYQNFNFCLTGSIFVPATGNYTFVLTNHDDVIWGIGGGATLVSATSTFDSSPTTPTLSTEGQTITVAQGIKLLPRGPYTSGLAADHAVSTVIVHFPNAGIYPIEIDYDYWYHSGRILLLMASPTPSASPTIIPPLPGNVRQQVQYRYVYRSSATGAMSNPSPESTAEAVPVTANTVTSLWSDDPQVDVVDYYRIDSVTSEFTYVATGPNDDLGGGGTNTPITDSLLDTELGNKLLEYDNFEPFPSIDLPQKGTCSVAGGVITWLSGGAIGGSATGFNVRWLGGTTILIGYPTSLAYIFIARPTSTTSVTIPGVPDGTNLVYEIPEPILAAQPLPYLFGPTDNINFTFGVGDPLRPGTLYWSKGNNLDSAPDTNQMDVTDPGEPLVNGAMSGGRGVLFSIRRAWVIMPNFFNALATATGTQGSTWTLEATGITRGLFMPRCVAIEGGGNIFFRVSDGIHVSPGGGSSVSISDSSIYPLFEHEGSSPQPITRNSITIYPPDDSQPQAQRFSVVNQFLYYDYIGLGDGQPHTLVYDIDEKGWVWDVYDPPVVIHASNDGISVQGVLAGCLDGTVRTM